jgi:hypothetical protein
VPKVPDGEVDKELYISNEPAVPPPKFSTVPKLKLFH